MEQSSRIRKFFDFDEEDVERLRVLRPAIEPHVEEVVEEFYAALNSNTHTRCLVEGSREREKLREFFRDWLLAAFDEEFGEAYVRRQRELGSLHQELGLEPEYVFGAMNRVRTRLVELVLDADLEIPDRDAIASIERVLDMSMTLALDAYWETLIDEKDELGTELASFMAHEIRNPLNAVELNMTLLQRRLSETFDDPDEYLPMLEAVRSELSRIENLTSEIKAFTQPISVTKSWHELPSLVDELESSHSALFAAAAIEFRMEVDEGTELYCDAERLKQVIVNLLKNSVEAIEGEGEVILSAETSDEETVLRVSDTGGGVDPASSNRIFELFYTTKSSGTGLGLPIAKKIVEGHDGSIDVRRNDRGGSTVEVSLPNAPRTDTESASGDATE